MRLEARLRDSARRFAGKTALVAGDVRLTYGELDARSDRLAESFASNGVKSGDRVLMLLDNGPEAVLSFFGAWKIGAVPCPLYPSIKADKLAAILDSTEACAIVTQARLRPTVEAAVAATKIRPAVFVAQGEVHDEAGPTVRFEEAVDGLASTTIEILNDPDSLALLIHTSGSTGKPKGVMLSHANVDSACRSIVSYLGNTAEDIVLNVLPLSFGYGITQVVTMIMVGGTLILEKSFAFPRKILERLAQEKVTGFPLVPPMAALVVGMKDLEPDFLPHLRYITSAAAAMPPAFSERLQHLFPQTQLFLMYGQTECMRATYLPPAEVARRPLSAGKAIPGTHAYVIDEDGNPAPPGVIGELIVEGPHVMLGYWHDASTTLEKLVPLPLGRRLHTGDLFSADEDGFLYFVSRRDDIIKTRGEKVSPQEVERALYELTEIAEAAVGGVPDPVFGEVIRAYVVLRQGAILTERDIIRHCAGRLEDYMVPKSVEFRDALPRTTTGKIRLNANNSNNEPTQGNVA